ncbi:hypothetical protein BDZ97DRAFT_1662706 [Flammula alnicola]|nr:hypothetical protein BDZ97DRAFT_1662706 [Flammula alnicola]
MASASPVVFHQPKHVHTEGYNSHHARARLPVIPDLRFEYSYLRSIRPYVEVEVERVGGASENPYTEVELVDQTLVEEGYEKLDTSLEITRIEKETEVTVVRPSAPSGPSEIIRVQWKKVIWVTMRDQVISPLLQGALWALASYYLTPFSAQIGSRMGTFVHERMPTKEGLGVTWLRNWAKNIGLSSGSHNANIQTQRTSNTSSFRY